jgi:hypothetical protein
MYKKVKDIFNDATETTLTVWILLVREKQEKKS